MDTWTSGCARSRLGYMAVVRTTAPTFSAAPCDLWSERAVIVALAWLMALRGAG